ncbi:unnamed protein product [Cylindrotheca closterium]|uniref:Mitochondrial inner membrane protease subunit n=1 Tax=Cylindrotheca closterium TaxID=2856 RepID=A0AAD2FP49_9STRA|nr:unnamed protein product [Cylindrotheca closterium]
MFARFRQAVTYIPIRSTIVAVPLAFYVHDSFYSFVRVNGSSMEPTLRHGDLLLVRKSDNPWWSQLTKFVKYNFKKYVLEKEGEDLDEEDSEPPERIVERRTLKDYERLHCATSPSLQIKPPLALSGDIVVYKDPQYFFHMNERKLCVKRVVGLGGQVVMVPFSRDEKPGKLSYRMDDEMKKRRTSNGTSSSFQSMRVATTCVAPYSMWVEGDNRFNSYDSQHHGSISKHLVVGLAEYVVWPPTRFQKLSSSKQSHRSLVEGDTQPYAYWP